MPASAQHHSPAAERNRDPILSVLRRFVPDDAGDVLEVASGSGQHAAHFGAKLPHLRWQPTDQDETLFTSIQTWCRDVPSVAAPIALDVHTSPWPVSRTDVVVNLNMIHISPWSACLALLDGASGVLQKGGVLFMYGPYAVDGAHTAESNARFDADLKRRNPSWGVRDLGTVIQEASARGMAHRATVPMPANNLSVVYEKM